MLNAQSDCVLSVGISSRSGYIVSLNATSKPYASDIQTISRPQHPLPLLTSCTIPLRPPQLRRNLPDRHLARPALTLRAITTARTTRTTQMLHHTVHAVTRSPRSLRRTIAIRLAGSAVCSSSLAEDAVGWGRELHGSLREFWRVAVGCAGLTGCAGWGLGGRGWRMPIW